MDDRRLRLLQMDSTANTMSTKQKGVINFFPNESRTQMPWNETKTGFLCCLFKTIFFFTTSSNAMLTEKTMRKNLMNGSDFRVGPAQLLGVSKSFHGAASAHYKDLLTRVLLLLHRSITY